jgi:DNA repair exonuclease SbcCD nuclease subunit
MTALIEAMKDLVPVRDCVIVEPVKTMAEYMSVYHIADAHLGMYAWAEESGENFDTEICRQRIIEAVDRLVDTQPASELGIVQNLGDLFHCDNDKGLTEKSGNILDTDGRYGKVVRIGVAMMIHVIERALEKHKKVEVYNVPGNHDRRTSFMLSVALAEHFRKETRVTIAMEYKHFFYREFGNVLIGMNHGMLKPQRLLEVMVTDRAEAWGRTKYREFHVGHNHQHTLIELGGLKIESFGSVKAKDAYEAENGYRAMREMQATLYHSEMGRSERHIVCAAMLSV